MERKSNNVFCGGNLRLLRNFHGYTLQKLGTLCSVSRQYIQKLENDPNISPSDELLSVLAEELNVKRDFFFNPVTEQPPPEICRFRKRKTTPLHSQNMALAYSAIFNRLISYLEKKFEFPPVEIPEFQANTKSDIERIAEKCRRQLGLGLDTPIHNMVRTVEKHGGIVATFKGLAGKIDAFSYITTRPIVVKNEYKNSTSRARFDVAHEFGHIVMHNGLEEEDSLLEEQAFDFASAFLLPRVAFYREFPKSIYINWSSLFELKIRWGVSLAAMVRRAFNLGILSASQYRNANIYISRKGWKKNEPEEDKIPSEHSEVLPGAFEYLKKEGFSPWHVANLLNIDPFILEKFNINIDNKKLNGNVIPFNMLK